MTLRRQFDSWFYPKDGAVNSGGGGGAVTNWTSLDDVFPSGMAAIQEQLGMPIVMHNRQWSNRSDYIRDADVPYEWATSDSAAAPLDAEAFFTWFFKQQAGWGLTMCVALERPRARSRTKCPERRAREGASASEARESGRARATAARDDRSAARRPSFRSLAHSRLSIEL